MFGRKSALAMIGALVMAAACGAQTAPTPANSATPAATTAPAVTPEQAQMLKGAEKLIRDLYAWGPEYGITFGPLKDSDAPSFYVLPIQIQFNGQKEDGTMFLSKDGKTVIRGEMFSTAKDPYADNRAKMHIEGNPSKGPADAKVTLVEFADFQCPHCRELHEMMGVIEQKYPQIRVVYKDFPLTQIHEWAETAAIGARCAYMQSPAAFWKVHDSIFDNQDVISAENIWAKLNDYAASAGLDAAAFKACLSGPDAKKAVDANQADGVALDVSSTPTIYVNGHPTVGGDPATLDQFISYELAKTK